MRKLEVIAMTLEDAIQAQAGGATSLELCQDLPVGGLTPPLDVIRAIREKTAIHIRVLVRPHARSFVYSSHDMDVILRDIDTLKQIGVDGVVFGALHPDDTVNVELTRQVADVVRPLEMTFHRAIDVCKNADEALPYLKGLVSRILTSGTAESVWEGRDTIRRWIAQYGRDFLFACGGGIRAENLLETVRATEAHEYHVGTAARTNQVVDAAKVRSMLETINVV